MKKKVIILTGLIFAILLTSCGNDSESNNKINSLIETISVEEVESSNTTEAAKEEKAGKTVETVETVETSATAFDAFLNGTQEACLEDGSKLKISDLSMDEEEWDSYSVGEQIDLDNDGEDELIINGPYGGMYLDVRKNEIYVFARGKDTSSELRHFVYNGETCILYCNIMHEGYLYYSMEKYQGANNLVSEKKFGEELIDMDNPSAGVKYYIDDSEVSEEEYNKFCSGFEPELSTLNRNSID